jgi:hypothetical protein
MNVNERRYRHLYDVLSYEYDRSVLMYKLFLKKAVKCCKTARLGETILLVQNLLFIQTI